MILPFSNVVYTIMILQIFTVYKSKNSGLARFVKFLMTDMLLRIK